MAGFSERTKRRQTKKLPSKRTMAAQAPDLSKRSEDKLAKAGDKLARAAMSITRAHVERYVEAEVEAVLRVDALAITRGSREADFVDLVLKEVRAEFEDMRVGFDEESEVALRQMERDTARKIEDLGIQIWQGEALAPILAQAKDAAYSRITALVEAEVKRLGAVFENVRFMDPRTASSELAKELGSELLTRRQAERLLDVLPGSLEDPDALQLAKKALGERTGDKEVLRSIRQRADLLSRDQALTTNGLATEQRMANAGVKEYVWITSRDERVRDNHAALDGFVYSFDDPPMGGGTGPNDTGNPSSGIQCRCTPYPVIPELEDDLKTLGESTAGPSDERIERFAAGR